MTKTSSTRTQVRLSLPNPDTSHLWVEVATAEPIQAPLPPPVEPLYVGAAVDINTCLMTNHTAPSPAPNTPPTLEIYELCTMLASPRHQAQTTTLAGSRESAAKEQRAAIVVHPEVLQAEIKVAASYSLPITSQTAPVQAEQIIQRPDEQVESLPLADSDAATAPPAKRRKRVTFAMSSELVRVYEVEKVACILERMGADGEFADDLVDDAVSRAESLGGEGRRSTEHKPVKQQMKLQSKRFSQILSKHVASTSPKSIERGQRLWRQALESRRPGPRRGPSSQLPYKIDYQVASRLSKEERMEVERQLMNSTT